MSIDSKNDSSGGATAPLVIKSKHQVKIDKLAIGGSGLTRINGQVVFIPFTAVGDVAEIEISLIKKNYCEGKLLKVIQPSPTRISAPCPVFTVCGGCNWQHLSQEEQLRQKQSLVEEAIRKFNRDLDFEMLPIVPSPQPWRYRNRIQPKFTQNQFGFFKRESHDLVDVSDCLIVEEPIAAKFPELRKQLCATVKDKETHRCEVRINEAGAVEHTTTGTYDEAFGFSQVNRFQNDDLRNTVASWIQGKEYADGYDLYGGAGNFTEILLNASVKKITLVEMSEKLAGKARSQFSPKKVDVIRSDVELYLKRALIQPDSLLILDPPRAGASEQVMKSIAGSEFSKLIYISCHPVSLARDLAVLKKNRPNIKISKIQCFEMFPQTDHVETIVEIDSH